VTVELVDMIREYCIAHTNLVVSDLAELCAIPSVSAHAERAAEVLACGELLARKALEAGFHSATLVPTSGNPVLVARHTVDPNLPTVLVYGHYDVQPSGDESLWTSPPFFPTVRDEALWARGVSDDKGHLVMHLKALEAMLRSTGSMPFNVTLVAEGEEEIGSPNFEAFFAANRNLLKADLVVVSDTLGFLNDQPTICTGLRGLLLADVSVTTLASDAHSGLFGGAVRNPAEVLARMMASLKDGTTGRVLIDGFYDDVVSPSSEERASLISLPFDEKGWLASIGSDGPFGEQGWTTLERIWWRPTLEFNSLDSGDAGALVNTVVPSRARARLSCRLVADQSPARVATLLEDALKSLAPSDVKLEVAVRVAGRPVALPSTGPLMDGAGRAIERVFGRAPLPVRMGGSIPPVATFVEAGLPSLLVGVGKEEDNFHAIDEHLDIDRLIDGILLMATLWTELARDLDAMRVPMSQRGDA